MSASSESTGSDQYSWRKPGRGRLAYAVLWLAIPVLFLLTFGGVMTPDDYVYVIPLLLVPAIFQAVGFLLIRSKGGLFAVALLGLPLAFLVALVVTGAALTVEGVTGVLSQVAVYGLVIALLAAPSASLIAIAVLPKPKWFHEILGGFSGGGFG